MYSFQMDITELTLGVADNFQLQMLINNVDSGPKPHLCDISEAKVNTPKLVELHQHDGLTQCLLKSAKADWRFEWAAGHGLEIATCV